MHFRSLKILTAGVISVAISVGFANAYANSNFEAGVAAYERQDYATALRIWKRLAGQGIAAAQHNLAVMYDHGQGTGINDSVAVTWYRKAAEQGHTQSQYTLGLLYSRGQDVPQNMSEAVRWYTRAAEGGHVESQFILGVLHDFGKGVSKDDQLAVNWYRKAAEQGDARAQYNLALMYDFGQGGLDNPREATRWYRHAAEQGNAKAQYMLGVALMQGDGVAQDNVAAYAWMSLAAASGHVRARQYRSHPWKNLSAADRKRGRILQTELMQKVRLRRSLSTETPGRLALPTVELVRETQRVLAQKGLLRAPVDGVLGPQTRAAIKALQKTLRLPQTGMPSTGLLLIADPD